MHDPQAPPSLGVSTAHVSKRWAARLMHGRSDTPILRDRTTPHQPPATPLHRRLNGAPTPFALRAAPVHSRGPNGHATSRPDPSRDRQRAVARLMHLRPGKPFEPEPDERRHGRNPTDSGQAKRPNATCGRPYAPAAPPPSAVCSQRHDAGPALSQRKAVRSTALARSMNTTATSVTRIAVSRLWYSSVWM